jgi:hypothetical protein
MVVVAKTSSMTWYSGGVMIHQYNVQRGTVIYFNPPSAPYFDFWSPLGTYLHKPGLGLTSLATCFAKVNSRIE